MRQGTSVVILVVVVVVGLIALNGLSYAPIMRQPDQEATPNRSTYNSGASGTKALYDFLSEGGFQVVRWRDRVAELKKSAAITPNTFVIVGETRLPLENEETSTLLDWVAKGHRLILIDRSPNDSLLPTNDEWGIAMQTSSTPIFDLRSGDLEAMTAGAKPAHVSQPTTLTNDVENVQPSRFASVIRVFALAMDGWKVQPDSSEAGVKRSHGGPVEDEPPPPVENPKVDKTRHWAAPVVHLESDRGPLVVTYGYGAGSIALLSDPYVVSNAGIVRADNLQLAVNLLTNGGGVIAFDEYHQGQGKTQNELIAYFRGTPLLPVLGQASFLLLLVIWTTGKRFGRPLPLPGVDRRSSLEFVSSMAELQQRARAYDLAVENIYLRLRRVLVRYGGLTYDTSRSEIAARVAERAGIGRNELEDLMRNCEDVINGEPADEAKTVDLIKRLRELERRIGLGSRARDVKQERGETGKWGNG
jgi:hypothetical protein